MSTFKGVIDEFPDIQVDFFRARPNRRLPLRCFLSHVHSDHLDGLLSFKSPFIHCSPATKEILLRLERKKQRSMFASGITEAREKQYKHLKDLLKPIPLETPTKIELTPGNEIQITLFDANHCVGAVMFLFEGNGKAVLYTGDIRSEPWFINNLTRNPFMVEYSTGLKSLDCIYLDTSNTKRIDFPTKAEGLKELLQKISKYPKETVFHFSSWTFGYEEVWMALSKALNSPANAKLRQIHADSYKYRLYESLCGNAAPSTKSQSVQEKSVKYNLPAIASEGPVLIGYNCGNTIVSGCLTKDPNVRLHTCEKGTCQSIDSNENVVWIRPIVTRTKDGAELAEIGIGGGGEDLTQSLELAVDEDDFEQTIKMLDAAKDPHMTDVKQILVAGWRLERKFLVLNGTGLDAEEDSWTLTKIVTALLQLVREPRGLSKARSTESQGSSNELPKVITFPYSRHSSYDELCDLVRALKPRDVYPCTVDEQHWDEANLSISNLFGRLCSSRNFRHEKEMDQWRANRVENLASQQTHTTTTSQSSQFVTSSPEPIRTIQNGTQPEYRLQENPFAQVGFVHREGNENLYWFENMATSPSQILAISPNGESQGLRRKAIGEQLEGSEVKRVRRSYDGSDSSPEASAEDDNVPTPESCFDEEDSTSSLERLSYVEEPEHLYDKFDVADEVWRCRSCDHEVLGGPGGFCTGKDCTESEARSASHYMEVLDPEAPPLPEIARNEDANQLLEGDRLKEVVGSCLDYDSSAYDSYDSEKHFSEEYDQNSFIDDAESEEDEGRERSRKDDSSGDDGPDYENMFNQLQAQHTKLINDFSELDNSFRDFRRDVGVFSSDDDDDELDEEVDDEGLYVVDVRVPDPVTTDIVVFHAQEQSQESEDLAVIGPTSK
ncbi:uncharacterized protein LY89DRAFT_764166 [Mollisia scopiformis]|uniref:Protein artemis n=1 Tax=Mollisia scopiformis TaxID=149040 RepID=A0A132BAW4_MOLSC|nr:uncharacterized protein LY89DRAFT_764166 [Mollisia scopiformis]KUJ08807.1 hypothetical protein LY89DRAFT_764166 [Mollisia scopiformis]